MSRAWKIALGILVGLVLLVLIAFGLMQTDFGRRQILALIEDQLSDPPAHLQAQALEGFVPFDMTLVGAKLSDAGGVWLEADRLSLDWSPSALLGGTASITNLAADRIAVLRSPISPPSPPSTEPTKLELPRLPVDVDLQRLKVERLELGPEFLGEPAVFAIEAQAKLGDPADGLQAKLTLSRIDRDLDRIGLTLDYRPAADSLTLDIQAEEPQGGLLTRLIGLPGTPKFALSLSGNGPLANWQAAGQATTDGQPLLDLTATSKGPAEDRTIAFNARLRDAPMLPADLAAPVEGGVAADGQVHIAARDQPIRIDHLKIETRAGTVSAQGSIAPDRALDLTLDVRLADSAPFAALLPPELRWDAATAQLHLAGPIAQPKLTAESRLTNLAYAEYRIGDGQVSLAATLDTEKLRADAVTVSIAADAITVADPKLQAMLAEGATIDFAGALDQSGAITADHLQLRAGTIGLDAAGAATGWGVDTAQVKGKLAVGDLAPILDLAGLHGGGKLNVDLDVNRTKEALSAQLDVSASDLATGIAEADRLIGATPKLSLKLHRDPTGLLTVNEANLTGAGLALTAGGTMTADQMLDLKADARLADLGRVLPNAKGAISLSAVITGNAADPAAKLQIGSERLTFDRVTIARLQAAVDATALVTAPNASIDARAQVNALAAALRGNAGYDPASEKISATDISARLGAAGATGKIDVAGGLLDGVFDFTSPNLAELAPLIGTDLGGSAKGKVALRPRSGKQDVTLDVTADTLVGSGVRIAQAQANASAADAFGKDPQLDATLAATGIDAVGRSIETLNAKANGRLSDLAVTADARGPDLALLTQLNLKAGGAETRIALARLDLTVNRLRANLQQPAEITLGESSTRVAKLVIASGGGTAALDAELGTDGNRLVLTLKQLPASLAAAAAPDLHLLGTLNGTLRLDGPKSAPQAQLALQGKGLGVSGASEQLVDLDLTGNWTAGQLTANGRATMGKSSGLDFAAALPMAAAPGTGFPVFDPAASLTASAKGEIDLGLANAFIPGGADHVAGRAAVDLSATGAVARPVLAGKLAISDGRYENQRYGTRLQQLTAVLEGNGSKLRLVSLSARTPGGGTLSGEGDLDFADAMPVTISIKMDKARMINAPIGTAVTDGTLQIKGTMTSDLALTGKVKIVKAEIRIPDSLPVDVEEIAVKEINLPPARQAAVDAVAEAPPPKTIKIALDLAVDAPEQVFVRGRGLDAEMGGALKIAGTADAPIITGALKLRRGDFDLLSRRLDFNKGTVTFSGGERIDPVLDFAASTKLTDADVTVTVTGSAAKPVIALSSTPPLPQDEILARLLFGKASGALSPFEAVQLAQAMAQLTGLQSGPGVLDKLRKALGLDRLDVEAGEGGATSAPSLSAGRYVSRGVFVGAKQGATPGTSAATVEIELTPNIKVETDVGADSKAGVNFEWNY
ncbi:translocation/assembly module TamB domain-containing protein [Dongia sedimenti]|uniref:Translocation/assembly module TamB domain-containing protein n=1 Tax=Dongia sedimenti TaxID=3064282 RepID=A0ABU0YSB6_9PROT|nr:translocation/assembly module TamB domain-containing protein [Rhodospirillaceae bacterium R-7]